MAGKTLSYFNLTGGLNTVQTMATINSTTNRTESPEMVNVEYFKLSGLRTMNGNTGLNKVNGVTSSINLDPQYDSKLIEINFGYEYIQGNNRYMIVADKQTIYEYNPITDRFNALIAFDNSGDGITICGYANGIVAASPVNDYLIYYRKGRQAQVGIVSTASPITKTLTYTGTQLSSLGTGDIVYINDTEYNIDSVDIENNTIILKETPVTSYTDEPIILGNFTKIPCISTFTNQGSPSVITTFTPKIVQSHQGRLWVAAKPENHDTTSVVIYSDLGAIHNVFEGGDNTAYDGGYFEEFWEDTSEITAIGTWDKYVVVHKREHTYLINTSASDATTWNVESYSEYTCDNQCGFVKANNGYYTYCSSVGGIYPMIQRTIYSAITQGAEASTKIRDTFLNLNTYALDEIYAVYHPYKKYIMFYMPMIGEDGSNNCYIYDLQTKTWLHRKIPQNVTTAFEFDNKVYIGTQDGKIYEEFRGLSFDGEPIKFSWKSPWFIWGGITNWTTTREIRIKMSQEGTNNFYIRNRRDGNEDYKQRTITNTSEKTNNLQWDEGVYQEEINNEYLEEIPLYRYNINGTNYYSYDNPINQYSWVFEEGNQPTGTYTIVGAKAAGAYIDTTLSDENDYDYYDLGVGAKYRFTYYGTKAQYLCYRSSTDPNIKIWVNAQDTTQGIINLKKVEGTAMYAFYGVNINGTVDITKIFGVKDEATANMLVAGSIFPVPMYWKYDLVNWTRTYRVLNATRYIWGGLGGSQGQTARLLYGISGCNTDAYNQTEMLATSLAGGSLSSSLDAARSLKLQRAPQFDSPASSSFVWNGSSTRSGISINNQFTYSDTQVVYQGVTYNRYPAGDEGTIQSGNDTNVYSSTQTLVVGQTVYTDTDLTNPYGTIDTISDDNYYIDGRLFVPNGGIDGEDPKYYKVTSLFDFDTTYTPVETLYVNNFYKYPTDSSEYGTEKKLTDSKWDGNEEFTVNGVTYPASTIPSDSQSKWVNTGQVTKRFLIDRQYFQTLQLEFCGETDKQGIELYGFEVDGIQLTEVPW